jgi:phosphoglycerol transferase MdoB-like AlkP superfamily enzyme
LLVALVLAVAAATNPGEAAAPQHDLEIIAFAPRPGYETGALVQIEVEIGNRGPARWSAEGGFALSYHWFDEGGGVVVRDGRRTPLVEPVGPGENLVLSAELLTPERPGTYLLQWDVVHEGVLWVTEVDPTPPQLVPITVAPSHAFTLVDGRAPRFLTAGGAGSTRLRVRNDGLRTWPANHTVSLAYHWLSGRGEPVEWEGRRTAVEVAVPPGETVTLDAVVAAPHAAGRFRLQWDMVEDGVCWFSERSDVPAESTVLVAPPPPTVLGWGWTGLVAVAAVAVIRRGRRGGVEGGFAAVDLGWLVGAVTVKQAWLLSVAGPGLSMSGWFLTLASGLVIAALLAAFGGRFRPWFSWLLAAAATATIFVDALHERFFGDLVSVAALQSASQVSRVEASVRSLLQPGDLWLWADLVAGMVVVASLTRFRVDQRLSRRASVWAASAAAVLTAAGFTVMDRSVSMRQIFHTTHLARQVGVLNLHAVDVGSSLLRAARRPHLDDAAFGEVVEYFEKNRGRRSGAGPLFGAARSRNLLMIQVESLQAFVIGMRVGGVEVTPNLNALAWESVFVGEAADQTEEGRSSDAELASQVSLLPPDRGAAAFLFAGNGFTGLASILAERGYATVSAVPFDGAFWNRRATHRAYGYEHSLFAEDFTPGVNVGWGLNDRDFLIQAADRLSELPEPWCAYLLTLSLHHPFQGFPDELKRLDVGRWEGTPFGNFLHTMHHFDGALALLEDELSAAGLAERTVIALWGDHDAGFEWRPEIAAAMGYAGDSTGWYLSQRVPFIVRVPGLGAPSEPGPIPAGHTDVAPTLLALLGVDPAAFAFVGRNLLGAPGPGPVVGEYRCWHDATHVYLRRGPRLGDGLCVEFETLEEVEVERCRSGFEEARRQVEISRRVLEHDLQQRLLDELVR